MRYDLVVFVCKERSGLIYLHPAHLGDLIELGLCIAADSLAYEVNDGLAGVLAGTESYSLTEAAVDKDIDIGFLLYFTLGSFDLGLAFFDMTFRERPISRFDMADKQYFGIAVKFPVHYRAAGFFVIHRFILSE